MALEVKKIEVVANDDEIKTTVHLEGQFGWKLESEKKVRFGFKELVFVRDTDAPWWKEVCELEAEVNLLDNEFMRINSQEPSVKTGFSWIIFWILLGFAGVGLIYGAIYLAKKDRLKKINQAWHKEYDSIIGEIVMKRVSLTARSVRLVQGEIESGSR